MDLSSLNLAEFAVASEGDSVMDLAKIMKKKMMRNVFILDKKENPIGVVSLVDINNEIIAEGKDYMKIKAKEIMNYPVWTIDEKENISKAYYSMLEKKRYALPVTRNGKIMGILSMGEALKEVIKEKRNASAKKK